VFVKVVDEGSFSKAASSLGVPRSAVSQAVSALERELGVKLLYRSSRAMAVTEAGASLHRRAAPALLALEESAAEVTDRHGPLRGSIRMTAPVEVGTRLLEPAISKFLRENPGVNVELVLTPKVLDLTESRIDLAVRGGPVRDESLIAKRLGTPHQAGLFASPSYLAAKGAPRRVADLVQHDAVVVPAIRGRGSWTLSGPGGIVKTEVRARLSVDTWGYAVRAACGGVGIALLPLFLCEAERASGALVRVLPSYSLEDTVLWLLYPSARYLSRPVVALRDSLTLAFTDKRRR